MIRNIQHGFRIFSDVVGILFALGYCISISFMLLFKIGDPTLNYMMLVLTGIFLLFLILKLALLKDKPKKSGKVSKYGKRTYKYIKHVMRLVNAVMIVVSVVNVNVWDGSVVAPLITLLINTAGFLCMILFDVLVYVFKRKFFKKREKRKNKQSLTAVQEQSNSGLIDKKSSPSQNTSASSQNISASSQNASASSHTSPSSSALNVEVQPSAKKEKRPSLRQIIAQAREALEVKPNPPKDN